MTNHVVKKFCRSEHEVFDPSMKFFDHSVGRWVQTLQIINKIKVILNLKFKKIRQFLLLMRTGCD